MRAPDSAERKLKEKRKKKKETSSTTFKKALQ
jgi:hypothetical protein